MKSIPEASLSGTDKTIPLVGFGTAVYPLPLQPSQTMKESILRAIEIGYRHFDSAAVYVSEQSLGEAIADAIQQGFIESRDQLFITSKLWCSDAHHDLVLPALQKSLKNLGLEYLDLYLIHFPVSSTPGKYEGPIKEEDIIPMDLKSVWEAMEECKTVGLTKSIGVSNFSCKKLQLLLATANIPPAVHQVEMNPLWQQKKLREFCERNGIHVTAYSPLGAKGTIWGSSQVMECEVLNDIAKAREKTVAQVCLRWVHEQGVSVVVKSFNEERMKENLDIFDWKLSEEECEKINQISQTKGCRGVLLILKDDGSYKFSEDIWDGEID
ncbi:non-functional NADPH-dependent codeinone reductase 2-like isoform X1 [Actinidia eriantha]|uniref:non-functional NADPH-dependent codeinone reductase 2-like isoform X1 n=1 Tax=Actinidia eriantha TaxID=165200 RepID=UPI00258C3231|nr:non-functional NADPH-dependent codeinone reductase 2-like isoform X1 [Actinidia eriantha]